MKKLSVKDKLKTYSRYAVVDRADLNILVTAAKWMVGVSEKCVWWSDVCESERLEGERERSIKQAIKNVTSGVKRVNACFVGFEK